MSQDFKFKLKVDEMKENDPVKKDDNYHSGSNVRNVCFVQADGKMLFLNYGYLVACEYLPDESSIILNFTSHTVTLKGTKLESLYQEFFNHIPKVIFCTDNRYSLISLESGYQITEINSQEK